MPAKANGRPPAAKSAQPAAAAAPAASVPAFRDLRTLSLNELLKEYQELGERFTALNKEERQNDKILIPRMEAIRHRLTLADDPRPKRKDKSLRLRGRGLGFWIVFSVVAGFTAFGFVLGARTIWLQLGLH